VKSIYNRLSRIIKFFVTDGTDFFVRYRYIGVNGG
jgi:hypothetical protein